MIRAGEIALAERDETVSLLLREFEAESGSGTQPEAEGFLARLKDFWKACEK